MLAVTWSYTGKAQCSNVEKPHCVGERDVVVRITSCSICGSDLHLFNNTMKCMRSGDVLGHEAMGFVEETSPRVSEKFPVGQRVVISSNIACGECAECERENFGLCSRSNPEDCPVEDVDPKLHGQRQSGVLGFSGLRGAYAGCQAQFVRVPFADVNCLRLSPEFPDEKAIFLGDLFPTAWHATELGEIGPDSSVAVWGLGPVGVMTMLFARMRGAPRIIGIDSVAYRLHNASLLGFEVVNQEEVGRENVPDRVRSMISGGPTVCVDCAGSDRTRTWTRALEETLKLVKEPIDPVSDALYAVRSGGKIVVLGLHFGTGNQFPIGALFEKAVTVIGGGTVPVQRYWHQLYEKIHNVDISFLITHRLSLSEVNQAYLMLAAKGENTMKIILKPWQQQEK